MTCFADLAGLKVGDGFPVRVAGIVNASPESFYKGSISTTKETVTKAVAGMVDGGADIIDIGAVSTAPYKENEVSLDEEIRRIKNVMSILKEIDDLLISVDTSTSKAADVALSMGAEIVNDVTGFSYDKDILKVIKDHDASVILMARSDKDDGLEPKKRIVKCLESGLDAASAAGIDEQKIVVDPGIGFFREIGQGRAFSKQTLMPWYRWDVEVLRDLGAFKIRDRPVCVGVSRKSFIGEITGLKTPEDRLAGSLSATAVAVMNGADMVRTHDVKETVEAIRIAEALLIKP